MPLLKINPWTGTHSVSLTQDSWTGTQYSRGQALVCKTSLTGTRIGPRRYAPMGGSLAPVRVAGFRWQNSWTGTHSVSLCRF
jgi:hypothetical protein